METNVDGQEVIETTDTEVEQEKQTTEEGESADEKIARLEKEKEELEEKNKKLFARTKEAETKVKTSVSTDTISAKDFLTTLS